MKYLVLLCYSICLYETIRTIMTQSEIMAKLLEISENSYYRWKKKDHIKLIKLLERYFTIYEIEEF